MKPLACALTGHRVLPKDFDEKRLSDELEAFIGEGYSLFFCGMAEGFDLVALKALISLRARYSFEIEACVPYRGQENRFSSEMKALYRALLPECDRETVFFDRYTDGCFLVRNRYMVDGADCVYAYCLRETGGTAYTVRYAKSKGKTVRFALL